MRGHILMEKLTVAFCVLLIALFGNFGFAQGETAAQQDVALIYDLQVKPGMGPEFENLIKTDLIPGLKKAGDSALFTFRTEFGQTDRYILAVPLENMAQLDTPDTLAKALGEKGLAYLMLRLNELTYSPRVFLISPRDDLSTPMQQGYEPKLAIMFAAKIAPGRQADFEKNAKAMQAALGSIGTKGILVSQVGFGGNLDEYLSFLLFDTFADVEKFQAAVGKIAAEGKLKTPADILMNREASVLIYLPEQSFIPGLPPGAK